MQAPEWGGTQSGRVLLQDIEEEVDDEVSSEEGDEEYEGGGACCMSVHHHISSVLGWAAPGEPR